MMILALYEGDDRAVEALLAEDARHRSDAGDTYYRDPDAGPLLRSERWAAVRAKYPPPERR